MPQIIDVARQTWKETYREILPDWVQEQALANWYGEDQIARQVANPANAFYVAAGETGVVGFAHIARRQEPGEVELVRFYVLPNHQGKGLGRRLFQASLQDIRTRVRTERVYVQLEKENGIGRRSYEALGFPVVREYADDMFGFQTIALEMCLEL